MSQSASFKAGDKVIMVAKEPKWGHTLRMSRWIRDKTILTIDHVIDSARVIIDDLAVSPSTLVYADPELMAKMEAERKAEAERLAKMDKGKYISQAKALLKAVRQRSDNGIAVHAKYKQEPSVSYGPCHGFVRNNGCAKTMALVTLINRTKSQHGYKQVDEKIAIRWFDFIFNRSPWADCFEEKNALVAWNSFSVSMNVSAPANLLQGALMTTRHTWEKNTRVELWYKLVNLGVDERHAFLAMNFACADGDSITISALASDHSPVDAHRITKKGVNLFMSKPYKKNLTDPYNKDGNYSGVKAMWEVGSQTVIEGFRKAFIKACQEPSKAVVINPFMKAKKSAKKTSSMSVERYAAFVTSFFTELTA
tara:strand:- start:38726 stop:39823 length:1098 start_codon:yes stop_codon:yes gene_type:complete